MGMLKNGFDKKKLKSIMKNTMVVNYDKNKHNLNHIDNTKNSKSNLVFMNMEKNIEKDEISKQ